MSITLTDLRRFTVARNFFTPTRLARAIARMGFVQADPIRAPARAQDLILRQRVKDYRAGDLERRFESLEIEEDFFVVYGFVTRSLHALMHPRCNTRVPVEDMRLAWPRGQRKRAELLLEFLRAHGPCHPREVEEHFAHGRVTNYWGGSSNATTHLLDAMQYRGLVRVARREKGIRFFAARQNQTNPIDAAERQVRVDALVDILVRLYAPFPAASLSSSIRRLRFAAPQWQGEFTSALKRVRERLAHAQVAGVDWFWPETESLTREVPDRVRLLAPFDPLVRDRDRFKLLWDWEYRFEAYTPAVKRKLGYYALPMLWRDQVIGWANLSLKNGELAAEFGYVKNPPRDRVFKRELEAEVERMKTFLGLGSNAKRKDV